MHRKYKKRWWGIKERPVKRLRLSKKTSVPSGSVPEWEPKTELGPLTYKRRKLTLQPTTPNPRMPEDSAEVYKAKFAVFIYFPVIALIRSKKPVWIILEPGFVDPPKPWRCNLLSGGSRERPQRGGVHIIGSCLVQECDSLTKGKHRDNFNKHLQTQYTPGHVYLSLQNIVLHSSPIACSVPPNGRTNKLIAMGSVTIASRRSSATEKPTNIDSMGSSANEKTKDVETAKRKVGRPAKYQPPVSSDTYLQNAKMKLQPPGERVPGTFKRVSVNEENKRR